MKIEKVKNRDLLDWFDRWVRKAHYEPCEPYESPPFTWGEVRNEIMRRMKDFDYLDNRWSNE